MISDNAYSMHCLIHEDNFNGNLNEHSTQISISFSGNRVHFQVNYCLKIDLCRGSAPDPTGELTALPRPPSWI